MSIQILRRVKQHVVDAGLAEGYTLKFFRWSDKDLKGKKPFIVFRQGGSGLSNILLQQTDVLIQLGQVHSEIEKGDDTMQAIIRLFRGDTLQPDIARFDPLGTVAGPFTIENDRKIWELTVRCFTEDQ